MNTHSERSTKLQPREIQVATALQDAYHRAAPSSAAPIAHDRRIHRDDLSNTDLLKSTAIQHCIPHSHDPRTLRPAASILNMAALLALLPP